MPAPLQKGTLLAASQTLQEDYFARTVILIIHHSAEDGSMGASAQPTYGTQRAD